jgi:hypothetical protein
MTAVSGYGIRVAVTTPALGFVFGYAGSVTIEWEPIGAVPAAIEGVGTSGT